MGAPARRPDAERNRTRIVEAARAALAEELASSDMTLDQLKSSYRESMLMQKVYDKVTESITTVPEEDIAAYYEENKDYYVVDEQYTVEEVKEDITSTLLSKLQSEAWDKWIQATKVELGVTYREGMEPATSTSLDRRGAEH